MPIFFGEKVLGCIQMSLPLCWHVFSLFHAGLKVISEYTRTQLGSIGTREASQIIPSITGACVLHWIPGLLTSLDCISIRVDPLLPSPIDGSHVWRRVKPGDGQGGRRRRGRNCRRVGRGAQAELLRTCSDRSKLLKVHAIPTPGPVLLVQSARTHAFEYSELLFVSCSKRAGGGNSSG